MTKERFDQFKNKILKLSQEADIFLEQFDELKTSKDMVIRLARKQKRQLELMTEERQKANEEIKIIQFELTKAHEKIKDLEKEKLEPGKSEVFEAPEKAFPAEETIDLEMLARDIDTKLAEKEEEATFKYMKKMDFGL